MGQSLVRTINAHLQMACFRTRPPAHGFTTAQTTLLTSKIAHRPYIGTQTHRFVIGLKTHIVDHSKSYALVGIAISFNVHLETDYMAKKTIVVSFTNAMVGSHIWRAVLPTYIGIKDGCVASGHTLQIALQELLKTRRALVIITINIIKGQILRMNTIMKLSLDARLWTRSNTLK